MKLITLEGLKEFWNGFKENLSKVAFSGDYDDLRNKPAVSPFPDSLKNPCAFQANGKTYDGSAAVNMGTVALAYGGTGAASAAAARTNLGLGAAATQDVADNLSTTSAGFTLDARQGTALKQNVDKLNDSLRDYITAVYVESLSVTIPAAGSVTTGMNVIIPAGYKLLTVIPRTTSNSVWLSCDCYQNSPITCMFSISNHNTQALDGKAYAIALLIRDR